MNTKINKSLRAVITLSVLVIGAFFVVKAMETNEVVKEVEEKTANYVYHFGSLDQSGKIVFEEGEPTGGPCLGNLLPCRWESETPLSSPMTAEEIEEAATVTARLNP